MAKHTASTGHRWRFLRLGGFDQVRIESGRDICHLAELDQKLWATLSCPTTGLELDAHMLALMDRDGDGRIRAPEVLAAVDWTCRALRDPETLLQGAAELPLEAINPDTPEGARVLLSARNILANLGKPDATVITAEDTADTSKIFATARFNGDGVIPLAAISDPGLTQAAADILACVGGVPDRSGAEGLSTEQCDAFFAAAREFADWWAEAETNPALLPLGADTAAASAAWQAVADKVDDYFTRTRLAGYDPLAATSLNPGEAAYATLAATTMSPADPVLAALPLAHIEPDRPLPLVQGINPAWAAALATLRERVVEPLLGPHTELTAADWCHLRERFSLHLEWQGRMRGAPVQSLGIARVRTLLGDGSETALRELIARDLELAGAADAIVEVDRLIHYHQYLYTLLNNFVALRDFYATGKRAIFEAGTLYLDGRTCRLCIAVQDRAAHSAMAHLSHTHLAYCDCVRQGGEETLSIVAAFTAGDGDNLVVGRHGIFYDRQGRDWDATIVRVIEQPIGVGEAFWRPYKRIGRLIAEQVEKFAGARDQAVTAGVGEHLTAVATPAPAAAAPFDIGKFAGIFAAVGLAVGAIGTALATVLASLLSLQWWQIPLALAGVLLAISVPSMLLAYLSLRARNLGPLLDANGWAINTSARINIPFGASLTGTASLPPGAQYSLSDPFAEKHHPWGLYLFLLLLIGGTGYLWAEGHLARWWSQLQPRLTPATQTVPAGEPQTAAPTAPTGATATAPTSAATARPAEPAPAINAQGERPCPS